MGCKRVLVIDDNQDLADGMAELMKLGDHEVDVALTGMAGVEAAAGGGYDFIFVDLGLPDIDGVECAQRIRAGGCKARILMMTGYSASDLTARARAMEDTELLTKPLDPAQVLERVG